MSLDRIQTDLHDLAVPIGDLVLMDKNPRLHPSESIKAIRASLHERGQMKPIVLASDGRTVIAGNGTLLAAREEGFTMLAAVTSDLVAGSPEAAAYAIADNRVAELSKFDIDIVEKTMGSLSKALAASTGFSVDVFPDLSTAPEDPGPPEENGEPVIESGAIGVTSIVETETTGPTSTEEPNHSLARYDLTFSDDATLNTFLDFARALRAKYPDIATVGDRVVEFLRTEADGKF